MIPRKDSHLVAMVTACLSLRRHRNLHTIPTASFSQSFDSHPPKCLELFKYVSRGVSLDAVVVVVSMFMLVRPLIIAIRVVRLG